MLIFVYGTLKKSMRNHYHLQNIIDDKNCIPVSTVDLYPMYSSGYDFPFLENQPGTGKIIKGELWNVPEENIHYLDSFEGVPSLYVRGEIEVECENFKYIVGVYFRSESTKINLEKCISEWFD